MPDFVKGPWEASRRNWLNEPVKHDIYITGDHGDGICTAVAIVPGNATSKHITHATARLIEVAPDYFEGVEKMLVNEDCGGDGWWEGWEILKAAHAKAKGGSDVEG